LTFFLFKKKKKCGDLCLFHNKKKKKRKEKRAISFFKKNRKGDLFGGKNGFWNFFYHIMTSFCFLFFFFELPYWGKIKGASANA
jgi:hypothetical protein